MFHHCVWAVPCHSPAAACHSGPCACDWHLPGFQGNTADCAGVQGGEKARYHCSELNKAVKESVLQRFAWSGLDEHGYGRSVYYRDGEELLLDTEQQSYFF